MSLYGSAEMHRFASKRSIVRHTAHETDKVKYKTAFVAWTTKRLSAGDPNMCYLNMLTRGSAPNARREQKKKITYERSCVCVYLSAVKPLPQRATEIYIKWRDNERKRESTMMAFSVTTYRELGREDNSNSNQQHQRRPTWTFLASITSAPHEPHDFHFRFHFDIIECDRCASTE